MVRLENHFAPTATISTAGPAFRTILLALKSDAPLASMTCPGIDFYLINEHRGVSAKFSFVAAGPIPKTKRARRRPRRKILLSDLVAGWRWFLRLNVHSATIFVETDFPINQRE